jgi:hypothetical protein
VAGGLVAGGLVVVAGGRKIPHVTKHDFSQLSLVAQEHYNRRWRACRHNGSGLIRDP